MGAALAGSGSTPALFFAGLALAVSGLAYKIALVPFHTVPTRCLRGSPTPVSAFFAVAPKAAGFAVLLRLLLPYARTGDNAKIVFGLLAAVAAATMVLANFAALRQTNLKRILAYSSMAHAGYVLIAVVAEDPAGLLFTLRNTCFRGWALLPRSSPWADPDGKRSSSTISPDSGGGIPGWVESSPSFSFRWPASRRPADSWRNSTSSAAAVRTGHLGLALVGVATSLVSVYYYFRIIRVMFMKEAESVVEADVDNPAVYLVLFLCFYAVLQLGLFPGSIVTLISRTVASF
ncbi:MAG: hypothetical protein MZV70_69155 [Desulfobacterales bacterium]|nr:hypothetical protein [Desulfobacterales bacterium]